ESHRTLAGLDLFLGAVADGGTAGKGVDLGHLLGGQGGSPSPRPGQIIEPKASPVPDASGGAGASRMGGEANGAQHRPVAGVEDSRAGVEQMRAGDLLRGVREAAGGQENLGGGEIAGQLELPIIAFGLIAV